MRLKRRIEERGKVLEFLSAFRRPVGKDQLLKTEEDYIEYFKTILYIKKHIDSKNKKLERERIWYALWRSMLWATALSLGLFLMPLLMSITSSDESIIDICGNILHWDLIMYISPFICCGTFMLYMMVFRCRAKKSITTFTIYDCAEIYKDYCKYSYRSYNILADCYALISFNSKKRDEYGDHQITYEDVETYMLLADAMLVATSKTYSLKEDEMICSIIRRHSEVMQVYYKECHYTEQWRKDAYIPSEIIDLLNKSYNTTTAPLSIDECILCGVKFEVKVQLPIWYK